MHWPKSQASLSRVHGYEVISVPAVSISGIVSRISSDSGFQKCAVGFASGERKLIRLLRCGTAPRSHWATMRRQLAKQIENYS